MKDKKKIIVFLIAVVVFFIIYLQKPTEALSKSGLTCLAVLIFAIILWVCQVFPEHCTALLMSSLFVIFKAAKVGTAFASFSTESWWVVAAAVIIGAYGSRSGFLKRVALYILKAFSPTFGGQTAALLIAGAIFQPAIPSSTTKICLLAPLGSAIGTELKYEKGSRGMNGLFCAAAVGANLLIPCFLTASYLSGQLIGYFEEAEAAKYTFGHWFALAWVWGVVVIVLSYIIIRLLYSPKEKTRLGKDYIQEQISALGSMSHDEKVVAFVIIMCVILWSTNSLHHIAASSIAVLGVAILCMTGVSTKETFRSYVPWDVLIMYGCIMSVAEVVSSTGVSAWISGLLGDSLSAMVGNPFIYVAALAVITYIVRFGLLSLGASVAILYIIFSPIGIAAGIHPFVTGFTIICSVNVWNLYYTNGIMIAGHVSAGDGVVSYSGVQKYMWSYMLISILGLWASIPLWQHMGLL